MSARFARIRWTFPVLAGLLSLAGMHALGGCSNDEGAKKTISFGNKAPVTPTLIVASDTGNNRIVSMSDMTGTGWQSYGPSGKYSQPTAVAVDAAARIYAIDTGGTRLTRVNGMNGAGWTVYGTSGTGTGQFQNASSVALFPRVGAAPQKILVADTGNGRLVSLDDLTGTNWTTFSGSGSNALHSPGAAVVDAAGGILIADVDHLVRIDSLDGAGWTSFGATGTGIGQFQSIAGLALDSNGLIYVADKGAGRIVRINDLSGAGWTAYSGIASPSAVAVDGSGAITIVDSTNDRLVRITDLSGKSLTAFGAQGSGANAFASPSGVAFIY